MFVISTFIKSVKQQIELNIENVKVAVAVLVFIQVLKNVFIKAIGNHSHLQSPEEIEVRTLKGNIKRTVISETTTVTKIYDKEFAS